MKSEEFYFGWLFEEYFVLLDLSGMSLAVSGMALRTLRCSAATLKYDGR